MDNNIQQQQQQLAVEAAMKQQHQQAAEAALEQLQQQAAEAATEEHNQQLFELFWNIQNQEIMDTSYTKKPQLLLARIKRVMKSVPDVHMVSAEAPALISKACEIFIQDLTFRSWINSLEQSRSTIQNDDILATIHKQNHIFLLLGGVISGPSVGGGPSTATGGSGGQADNLQR